MPSVRDELLGSLKSSNLYVRPAFERDNDLIDDKEDMTRDPREDEFYALGGQFMSVRVVECIANEMEILLEELWV